MSRLANIPIKIPQGVNVSVEGQAISISNGKVTEVWNAHHSVAIELNDNMLKLSISDEDRKNAESRSMLGTDYRHILNFVNGMHTPFETVLEIHGLGYRAKMNGNKIVLALGKSHDDIVEIPADVDVAIPNEREIVCKSYSKKILGDFVDLVSSKRKPDPYKAKGVRIRGRHYRIKKD